MLYKILKKSALQEKLDERGIAWEGDANKSTLVHLLEMDDKVKNSPAEKGMLHLESFLEELRAIKKTSLKLEKLLDKYNV